MAIVCLGLLALTFGPSIASAQRVSAYQATAIGGSYVSTGGTLITSGDDGLGTFSLPFNFSYDGSTVSSGTVVRVATNGWIQLTNGTSSQYSYYNAVGRTDHPMTICIFSNDEYANTGIYWTVTGTAPNRVLNIDHQGLRCYYSPYTVINAMYKLYETGAIIELFYSQYNAAVNPTSYPAGIGLNGAATPSFAYTQYQFSSNSPATNIRYSPPAYTNLGAVVKTLDFGNVAAGGQQILDVSVPNIGPDIPLTVSASISGAPDFTILSAPSSVAVGATGTIQLRFSPTNSNVRTATLSIVTNGRDSGSRTVSLTGFGVVPAMTISSLDGVTPDILFRKTRTELGAALEQGFLITSSGQGPLNLTSIVLSGDYPDQYVISRMPALSIPQGATDTLRVRYIPTMEGQRPARISVTSNAVQNKTHTANLVGTGVLPHLVITPKTIAFDSVGMGETVCRTLTFTNTGSDTLVIDKNYLAIADSDFHYNAPAGDLVVLPETSQSVELCFTPTHLGSRVARVRVTTNIPLTFESPRRDTSAFIVNVTGTGVPFGQLAVSGKTGMDSAVVGNEICREDTIWNMGSADLTVTGATISGVDAGDFRINNVTFPFVLTAGSFKVVTVCATPSSAGIRMAVVTVTSTTSGKTSTQDLPIAVFGGQVCANVPASLFANETVMLSQNKTATLTVTNCGDFPRAYALASTSGDYTLSAATTAVLAPGASEDVTVTFTPSARDARTGSINVTATDMAAQAISLGGIGGVVTPALEGMVNVPNTGVGETSAAFVVTIRNNGNVAWTPGAPNLSTANFAYVAGSGAENAIAAGATGTMSFTFKPSAMGANSATVTFPTATPTELPAFSFALNGQGVTSGVTMGEKDGYTLLQNYPNPFNPSTEIEYTLGADAFVTINVIDMTGNVVKTLVSERRPAGKNSVSLNASELASGSYIYEMTANGVRLMRSMLLSK